MRLKAFSFLITSVFLIANSSYASGLDNGQNDFRKKFIEFANDQVLDKNDLNQLKKIAVRTSSYEREFAEEVLNNLEKYKKRIRLTYSIYESDSNKNIDLEFSFTPTYSEIEKIPGKNSMEIISNISQKDTLDETKADEDRCGTASLINAYILMGGSFTKLAVKTGINKEFTYKNIHLLQEKIYNSANSDGAPGIESGYKYTADQETGNIYNIRGSGEIMSAAREIGLSVKPILGSNMKTIYQRKTEIENFFNNNPRGVLQVGVHLDIDTGDLTSPSEQKPQDHSVIVFKINKSYYLADSSGLNNGNSENVKKITDNGVNSILYYTSGIINGLTFLQ